MRTLTQRREYYPQETALRSSRRKRGVCYECERLALVGKTRCQEHQLLNRLRSLKHRGMPENEIAKAEHAIRKFNGICDACWQHESCGAWKVDHDHATGKFRGIIGHRCNVALGAVRDSIATLVRLRAYLERK